MAKAPNNLADLSLSEVASGIADGTFSSVEVTKDSLDRLTTLGRSLHCVINCDTEAARLAARRADEARAAGHSLGPLHGVPLAHKDAFYRAGRISTCGSRILSDYVPEQTATVLERLDASGALDVAQLNMTEFATGAPVFGHNRITGTPCNPWNTDYGVGGSSSGPAAAVAARLVPGALASDTGGSIRIPASCTGLVGIKPTYGRVSRFGAMPLAFSFDHPGVMTRTIADCALMLEAIAGHDPHDPTTSELPVPHYSKMLGEGVKGLRIGVPENYFNDFVVDEIRQILEAAVAVLSEAGADIVPVRMPDPLDNAVDMHRVIFQAEAASFHREWLEHRSNEYGPWSRQRIEPGLKISATSYIEAQQYRAALSDEFDRVVFDRVEVLFAPVVPIPLPTLAESDPDNLVDHMDLSNRVSHTTRPINFLGLPALSVPAGFDQNGLPVGFQLIGRSFDEALLFQVGQAYERETNWPSIAPPITYKRRARSRLRRRRLSNRSPS